MKNARMMVVALITMVYGANGFAQSNKRMDYDSTTDLTIVGMDVDGNGVRDDIDAYIDRLPNSERQKEALYQLALAEQLIMVVNINEQSQVLWATQLETNAVACVHARYETGSGVEIEPGLKKFSRKMDIFNLSVNTAVRKQASFNYWTAVTKIPALPKADGDGCFK